jgi:hypothetical protein
MGRIARVPSVWARSERRPCHLPIHPGARVPAACCWPVLNLRWRRRGRYVAAHRPALYSLYHASMRRVRQGRDPGEKKHSPCRGQAPGKGQSRNDARAGGEDHVPPTATASPPPTVRSCMRARGRTDGRRSQGRRALMVMDGHVLLHAGSRFVPCSLYLLCLCCVVCLGPGRAPTLAHTAAALVRCSGVARCLDMESCMDQRRRRPPPAGPCLPLIMLHNTTIHACLFRSHLHATQRA